LLGALAAFLAILIGRLNRIIDRSSVSSDLKIDMGRLKSQDRSCMGK
jgi:hypothetical protein